MELLSPKAIAKLSTFFNNANIREKTSFYPFFLFFFLFATHFPPFKVALKHISISTYQLKAGSIINVIPTQKGGDATRHRPLMVISLCLFYRSIILRL